nr:MAG TPA: hypothetical protein [Caudoviricetes sp.]
MHFIYKAYLFFNSYFRSTFVVYQSVIRKSTEINAFL